MSAVDFRRYTPWRRELAEAERLERIEITRQLTLERLTACHGPRRAASIMAGTDPATLADIAAWRRLGAR